MTLYMNDEELVITHMNTSKWQFLSFNDSFIKAKEIFLYDVDWTLLICLLFLKAFDSLYIFT